MSEEPEGPVSILRVIELVLAVGVLVLLVGGLFVHWCHALWASLQ